ncbi:UDP-2,3-diacylglucosamine diphosphatase [Legionella worsleiensis]|uniref:UDP-2,3-diacylglucosamine hydrolase n=1 Tax=Legionella worsleiensis TaxID=45076 RepID=A0A0W1AJF8_9GAMM|nr:UDP-2,3-diacylglucosamine diphosphatase [Legionella worsleiensis]KTD81412.1 UDP-2,3-diacylglucosamine hydrolase [Legionella worsleiensis]STY30087.1 UDP-2,3-diacylglucosamine hydrolase [Legionella worsleiensis]
MIDAVFISDLHLHPENSSIHQRFSQFLEWAQVSVKKIYILGDFFHAWAGDDSIDDWSRGIASQLFELTQKGIALYFMCGNRDFLLGKQFAKLAGWTVIREPTVIELGNERVLLVHGDGYCTRDRGHQRLRLFTRNRLFVWLFLSLSLAFRKRIVNKVRSISSSKNTQFLDKMDVVGESVIKDMTHHQVRQLIHGHTHKPGLTQYFHEHQCLQRYVLSDWDDSPEVLCYDRTKGIYFIHPLLQEENRNVNRR